MKKWPVKIVTAIQAGTREEAREFGKDLCEKKLRGLATVFDINQEPLPTQDERIAVNELVNPRCEKEAVKKLG